MFGITLTVLFALSTIFAAIPINAADTETEVDTVAYLSFRPTIVGKGQTFLVNIWVTPATHVQRNLTGYTVIITKPDGTVDKVGPLTSYDGDATAWFEYVADQVGNWTLQFVFEGCHCPSFNTTASMFSSAGTLPAAYYKPSESKKMTLTVQEEQVNSWPASAVPTDYWTRPVSPNNREWASILGNYPYSGYMVNPPEDTNSYASNYKFTPYVQGPETSHVVWKRLGALSGIIGGDFGPTLVGSGEGTYAGTPNIIFQGRCYQSITAAGGKDVLQCYDLRTGEVYWQIDNPLPGASSIFGYSTGSLTGISVSDGAEVVPGATASAVGQSISLLYVGSNRLVKLDAYTGKITLNVTALSGTYYRDPYVLSVQTLSPNNYRLINWTTAGTETNFTNRIFSNVSFPFSSLGVCDYEAGVAVSSASVTPPDLGAFSGSRIMAASLTTGQLLWNITDTDTIYSSSTAIADHGKFAVCMFDRHWDCYSLTDGSKLWESETAEYPWGFAWAYSVASAYGSIYGMSYNGIYAFDWDTGKIVWHFEAPANPYETPYIDGNGSTVYSFMSTPVVADGKIYVGNGEHSPTSPITRGWRYFCIDAITGEGIWNVTGGMVAGAVADGYITADNRYDGYMYVFGKGKTETTISVPQVAITSGTSAIISGTIFDMSPAQEGTACVSAESMTEWMEYLHMQGSIPTDVTGVPISIDTIDPNGNPFHIADVTSDMSGQYKYTWTPTIPGDYTITATFMGDKSYGSSWAETFSTVVEAPAATVAPTIASQSIADQYFLPAVGGIIVTIIVAFAVTTMLILRKRQ